MQQPLFIIQQHGLGDIIFTQTLIKQLAEGAPVIWPVKLHDLGQLYQAYPNIQWVREDLHMLTGDQVKLIKQARVVPINRAYEIMSVAKHDWMKAKYELYGMDWRNWRLTLPVISSKIFDHIRIEDGPYNLINDTFRNDKSGKIPIRVNNGYRSINMSDPQYADLSLFDWVPLLAGAVEIHFVNSALLYLIELFDCQGQLHIYDRWPDEHKFPYVHYIMSKEYICHIHPI